MKRIKAQPQTRADDDGGGEGHAPLGHGKRALRAVVHGHARLRGVVEDPHRASDRRDVLRREDGRKRRAHVAAVSRLKEDDFPPGGAALSLAVHFHEEVRLLLDFDDARMGSHAFVREALNGEGAPKVSVKRGESEPHDDAEGAEKEEVVHELNFVIENRLKILPKKGAPEDRAKRPPACFSEGEPVFPQPRQKPLSGPGRQASSSPGCTCRASSIMQRAQERAGSLSMCRCQMRWGSRRSPGCACASTVSGTSSDKALALRQGSVMTRFCRMATKKEPI